MVLCDKDVEQLYLPNLTPNHNTRVMCHVVKIASYTYTIRTRSGYGLPYVGGLLQSECCVRVIFGDYIYMHGPVSGSPQDLSPTKTRTNMTYNVAACIGAVHAIAVAACDILVPRE